VLSGATGDEMALLTAQAKDLGRTTEHSAGAAADAMAFLSMAGFSATETLGAMPGVLQLASAAQLELADAADITSNILTGYNMKVEEVGRVNDVLVATFSAANTDLSQLGEAFKVVGPIATSAGVKFEQTAAAVGLLGNAGIQGEKAGNALKNVMVRLLDPASKAAEELKRLGVNALDSSGRLLPLDNIISQLEPHARDTGAMVRIFGKIAGPSMAALVNQGSGALRELTKELENSKGTAAAVAAVTTEGLLGAWTRMKSATEGLAISVGEVLAPHLEALADTVGKLARWVEDSLVPAFQGLWPEVQTAGFVMAAAAIAAGPLLLVVGQMTIAFGSMASAVGLTNLALVGLAAKLAVAAGVFTLTFKATRTWMDFVAEKVPVLGTLGRWTARAAFEVTGLGLAYRALIRPGLEASNLIDEQTGLVKGAAKAWKNQQRRIREAAEAAAALIAAQEPLPGQMGEVTGSFGRAAGKIGEFLGVTRTAAEGVKVLTREQIEAAAAVAKAAEKAATEAAKAEAKRVAAVKAANQQIANATRQIQNDLSLINAEGLQRRLLELEIAREQEIAGLQNLRAGYAEEYAILVLGINRNYALIKAKATEAHESIEVAAAEQGFSTREELEKTAAKFKDTYDRMVRSGLFTTETLAAAMKAYQEAARLDATDTARHQELQFENIANAASAILTALFGKGKKAAIAQVIISTAAAIVKAFEQFGWPAGIIPAAAAAAIGFAQLQTIRSQNPGFALGTPGTRFQDFGAGTPTVLHGREAVVTEAQGASLAGMVGSAIANQGVSVPGHAARGPRGAGPGNLFAGLREELRMDREQMSRRLTLTIRDALLQAQ